MAVSLKTKSGKKLVPTVEEVSAGTAKKLEKYVPKTGGTFTGEIQIPQHSGDFVLADLRNTYPATEEQLGKAVNYTLLQVQNTYAKKDHGHTVATTSAAGFMSTQDKSKLDAVASTYLPLAGGTMTGELKAHNGLSLNSGTADFNGAMPYYLGIQSYAEGGKVFYRTAAEVKADLGINNKSDVGHTHSKYVDLSSAQTISGVKTFASEIKVGSSDSSKGRITFSDSNYAFIQEAFQDSILINGSGGIFLRKINAVAPSSKPTSSNYSTTNGVPAIGGYLSGTTLYLFTFGE